MIYRYLVTLLQLSEIKLLFSCLLQMQYFLVLALKEPFKYTYFNFIKILQF